MKDGSYSIEAALIMPIAILLMLMFLVLGFYIRDIVFTEAYGRNLLLEMADDTVERKNRDYRQELQSCLWCADVGYFRVFEGKKKIEVEYKISSVINFVNIRIENILSVERKEKTAEKLRKWKVITDTARNLLITEDE